MRKSWKQAPPFLGHKFNFIGEDIFRNMSWIWVFLIYFNIYVVKRRIRSNLIGHRIKNIPENSHTYIIKKESPHFQPHLSQNCRDRSIVSIMVSVWSAPRVRIQIIKVSRIRLGGRTPKWMKWIEFFKSLRGFSKNGHL